MDFEILSLKARFNLGYNVKMDSAVEGKEIWDGRM